jgi:hypothetical protein
MIIHACLNASPSRINGRNNISYLLQNRAALLPSDYIDFHRGNGVSYSGASIRDSSAELYRVARTMLEGPVLTPPVTVMLDAVCRDYLYDFFEYFKSELLMFTQHASDCQFAILTFYFSAIQYLTREREEADDQREQESPDPEDEPMWGKEKARLAWTKGCFAARYGPGAYCCRSPASKWAMWGLEPVLVDLLGEIDVEVSNANDMVLFISSVSSLAPGRTALIVKNRAASPSLPRSLAA